MKRKLLDYCDSSVELIRFAGETSLWNVTKSQQLKWNLTNEEANKQRELTTISYPETGRERIRISWIIEQ